MEIIKPYVIAPWEDRLLATIKLNREKAVETAIFTPDIQITTSSSIRKGIIRIGGAIHDTISNTLNREPVTYSLRVRTRIEQNPYTAELAAIAMAMRCLPPDLQGRKVTIFSSN